MKIKQEGFTTWRCHACGNIFNYGGDGIGCMLSCTNCGHAGLDMLNMPDEEDDFLEPSDDGIEVKA